MEGHELIQLSKECDGLQAVLLSRPEVSPDLGASGNYRLATLVMGHSSVRIYEAVSGTPACPAGRHTSVALSFAEMDGLIEAYRRHRVRLEEQARQYREAVNANDHFDPFLDVDHLP